MTLSRRAKALAAQLPPRRPRGIPTDPEALLAGLIEGRVDMSDRDPTDFAQTDALADVMALLVARAAGVELPGCEYIVR
jgi:hypothetical protein